MILILRLLGLALLMLLGQSLVAESLPAQFRPDLVLIFALAMGLRGTPTLGLICAFGLGFVVDVLSGAPLGLYALLRGTACGLTRLLDHALYLRATLPWMIYVAGYTVFDWVLLGGVIRGFSEDTALSWAEIATRVPGSVVLNTLIAAPLLGMFLRFDVESDDAGWNALASSGSRSRR